MSHLQRVVVTRLILVGLTALVEVGTPVLAEAQPHPRFDLAGGLTFLRSSDIVEGNASGWMASGAWNAAEWFALTMEVSRNTGSETIGFLKVNADFRTIVAGPRFAWRVGPLLPFGHILGGVSEIITETSVDMPFPSTGLFDETHGTLQIGGGVDVPIVGRLAARIAYDYRWVYASPAINQHRLVAGAVVGL